MAARQVGGRACSTCGHWIPEFGLDKGELGRESPRWWSKLWGQQGSDCDLSQPLQQYEWEDVVNSIHPSLLNAFAKTLAERGVISEYIKEDLDIIDPSISHELRCRYLTLNIREKISRNEGTYKSLLSIMDKMQGFKGCTDLYVYLCVEHHLAPLCEVLSRVSDKSIEIGTCLYLSRKELAKANEESSMELRLRCVISSWLSRSCINAKPATLNCLCEALQSEMVGEGRVAALVKESFGFMVRAEGIHVSASEEHISGGEIIFQSCSIKLDEPVKETTLLLEVMFKCSVKDGVHYEWFKDERSVSFDTMQIFCIRAVDLTSEGRYVCEAVAEDMCRVRSNPIQVSFQTPLDDYMKVVKKVYASEPEIMADPWPRNQNQNTFINLALIKEQDVDMGGEYILETIKKDADVDFLNVKAKIDYKDAFSSISPGNRVIVEGRPGSGKTTLVHRISQDWARGDLRLSCTRLLFVVILRGFRSDPAVKLRDIVALFFDSASDVNKICEYAEKRKGLGLAFILDGLDEYQPQDKGAYIFQLIEKRVLHFATVIVSSRPAAIAKYRSISNKRIEVLGFFKKQIREYVDSYKFKSKETNKDLMKFFNQHPNVHHMCYLPIQTKMVCFLFDILGSKLPRTETKIYDQFATQLLLRTLCSSEPLSELKEPKSLNSQKLKIFLDICRLAFEMTRFSRQILKQEEVDEFENQLSLKESLGLITLDLRATQYGFQNVYSFHHLTFQEFLAAYYIKELKLRPSPCPSPNISSPIIHNPSQFEIIQSCGPLQEMKVVFRFYCGLAKFDEKCERFKALLKMSNLDFLFRISCSFESQQKSTCDFVAEDGCLKIERNYLSPSDFTSLGYVISNARKNPVKNLILKTVLYSDGVDALINEIKGKNTLVTIVGIEDCSTEHLKLTAKLVLAFRSVKILCVPEDIEPENLRNVDLHCIDSELMLKLKPKVFPDGKYLPLLSFDKLTMLIDTFITTNTRNICFTTKNRKFLFTHLRELPFYFFSVMMELNALYANLAFTMAEALSLSDDLRSGAICKQLTLFNCNIDDEKCIALAEGLKENKVLESLNVVGNHIGDAGALAISEHLKSSGLCKLDVGLNKISRDGVKSLYEATKMIHGFYLGLFGNCISDTFSELPKNSVEMLTTLSIKNVIIGDVGMNHIESCLYKTSSKLCALHLEHCGTTRSVLENLYSLVQLVSASLLSLKVIRNDINDEGAELLSKIIRTCSKLRTLSLKENNIGVKGACALASSLPACQKLTSMDLSNNLIKSAGAGAIFHSLCSAFEISELRFDCCAIGDDCVQGLADVIVKNAASFRILSLCSNNIGDTGAKYLGCALSRCQVLSELRLGQNHIEGEGMHAIANGLNSLELKVLDLSLSQISYDASKAVDVALYKSCNTLVYLNLRDIDITTFVCQSLAEGLMSCGKLHSLAFGYGYLNESITFPLSKALRGCTELHTLSLQHGNHPSNDDLFWYTDESIKLVIEAIGCCASLKSLEFNCSELSDDAAKSLGQSLKSLSLLKTLNLSCTIIGDQNASILVNYILQCGNLCHFNFSKTGIHETGANHISIVLQSCELLETFCVSDNDIDDIGAVYVAEKLKYGSKLCRLDMRNTKLGDRATESLANTLTFCANLKVLDLSCNFIGDVGATALGMNLKQCVLLNELVLHHNRIGNKGAQSIAGLIRHGGCLSVIDMCFNCISVSGARYLYDAIKFFGAVHKLTISNNNVPDEFSIFEGDDDGGIYASMISCFLHQPNLGF